MTTSDIELEFNGRNPTTDNKTKGDLSTEVAVGDSPEELPQALDPKAERKLLRKVIGMHWRSC